MTLTEAHLTVSRHRYIQPDPDGHTRDRERYIRIVSWARRRFSRDGGLPITIAGNPAPFARIERAAFNRYINF